MVCATLHQAMADHLPAAAAAVLERHRACVYPTGSSAFFNPLYSSPDSQNSSTVSGDDTGSWWTAQDKMRRTSSAELSMHQRLMQVACERSRRLSDAAKSTAVFSVRRKKMLKGAATSIPQAGAGIRKSKPHQPLHVNENTLANYQRMHLNQHRLLDALENPMECTFEARGRDESSGTASETSSAFPQGIQRGSSSGCSLGTHPSAMQATVAGLQDRYIALNGCTVPCIHPNLPNTLSKSFQQAALQQQLSNRSYIRPDPHHVPVPCGNTASAQQLLNLYRQYQPELPHAAASYPWQPDAPSTCTVFSASSATKAVNVACPPRTWSPHGPAQAATSPFGSLARQPVDSVPSMPGCPSPYPSVQLPGLGMLKQERSMPSMPSMPSMTTLFQAPRSSNTASHPSQHPRPMAPIQRVQCTPRGRSPQPDPYMGCTSPSMSAALPTSPPTPLHMLEAAYNDYCASSSDTSTPSCRRLHPAEPQVPSIAQHDDILHAVLGMLGTPSRAPEPQLQSQCSSSAAHFDEPADASAAEQRAAAVDPLADTAKVSRQQAEAAGVPCSGEQELLRGTIAASRSTGGMVAVDDFLSYLTMQSMANELEEQLPGQLDLHEEFSLFGDMQLPLDLETTA